MKHRFLSLAAAAALAAGSLWAQPPADNPSAPPTPRARARGLFRARPLARIARALNLTDPQIEQARAIFQQARQAAQPARQQLQQNRQALREAIAGGGDVQTLATQQGVLLGQLVAIRSQAWAQLYGLLTPEQRAQFSRIRIR